MTKSLQHILEKVSIYLPVMLMMVLALGTWWLVRNAPKPLTERPTHMTNNEPDYVLRDFSVRQFDAAGKLQSEISGQTARHYPQSNTLEIDAVQTKALDKDRKLTLSSAQRGISNADASEVQLWGDAKVQKFDTGSMTPSFELESEFLHAWVDEEKVQTHLPVTLRRGNTVFSGKGMLYDHSTQTIQLNGHVKGKVE